MSRIPMTPPVPSHFMFCLPASTICHYPLRLHLIARLSIVRAHNASGSAALPACLSDCLPASVPACPKSLRLRGTLWCGETSRSCWGYTEQREKNRIRVGPGPMPPLSLRVSLINAAPQSMFVLPASSWSTWLAVAAVSINDPACYLLV